MSRRQNLEHHRRSLGEIREIMNSMKNLAYMESRKMGRYLDAQRSVVRSIEAVAADFISFNAGVLPAAQASSAVVLVLGSERGFCGNFNHTLLRQLQALTDRLSSQAELIPVGRKLYTLLEGDGRVAAPLEGASVLEEIAGVISALVGELRALQQQRGLLTVIALYHGGEQLPVERQILPPFEHLRQATMQFSCPPLLNLSPREFLLELTDHYLFAALYEILYASFMAENYQRVAHLEAAVRRLDEQSGDLARRCNALRQEEIIEEIEVILLSAASLGER